MIGQTGELGEDMDLRNCVKIVGDQRGDGGCFAFGRDKNGPKHMPLFGDFRRFAPRARVPRVVGTGAKALAVADNANWAETEMMIVGEPVIKPHGGEIVAADEHGDSPIRPLCPRDGAPNYGQLATSTKQVP